MPSARTRLRQARKVRPARVAVVPATAPLKIYRLVTLGLACLAVALVLAFPEDPRQLKMPDPWAYAFAIENFAQGKWVVTDDEMAAGSSQIRLAGGRLLMYTQLAPDHWVLRKSPGYPLLTIPFSLLGLPRLANVSLAILAALALYAWLATWRDEFTACLGVLLFLWAPISLVSLHYSTMDTFASGATLVIAGALTLWYDAKAGQGRYSGWWLLAAGLAAGWAMVVRLQNLPLLALLAIFIVWSVRRHRAFLQGNGWLHLGAFGLGLGLALTILICYNLAVFNHIFDTGYRYGNLYQSLFLWEENPATQVEGTPTWLAEPSLFSFVAALLNHLIGWFQPMMLGWPLLLLAVAGLGLALWRHQPLTWLMGLWLLLTYVPYAGILYFGITRELTVPFYRNWGFFAVDRYLFPASLPLAFLPIILLARWPRWLILSIMALYMAISGWVYWQALTY